MKPGALFRDYGNTIEKVAKQYKCQVVKTYCGHGINQLFHTVCQLSYLSVHFIESIS